MARKPAMQKKRGGIAESLSKTSFLHAYVKPGMQALNEPDKVRPTPPSFVTDSIALDDEAYQNVPTEQEASRWDYWIGTEDPATPIVGVEVHPIKPGAVKDLVKKKRWAESKADTELVGGRKTVRAWYWIASGKTALSKTTTEYRQMVRAGILLVGGCLRLPR